MASGTNDAIDNNGYDMQYVNTAPGTVPGLGAACPASASFDSSSATLSLPAEATVLFAGAVLGR